MSLFLVLFYKILVLRGERLFAQRAGKLIMKAKDIKEILRKKIDKYAEEKSSIENIGFENGKFYWQHIVLKRFEIVFIYSLKDKISLPASTLYCMVYPVKNFGNPYNLCEIVTAINRNDLRCCVFPYIENEERLEACFCQLTAILDEYMPLLGNAMEDTDFLNELENKRLTDIQNLFKMNDEKMKMTVEDEGMLNWCINEYEKNLVWRLTNEPAYQCFLQGRYEKAKKIYRKKIHKGKYILYEKLLYDFIGKIESDTTFEAIPINCYSYRKAKRTETPMGMIDVLIVFYIIWAGLFWGTAKIIIGIAGKNAVYVSEIEWYFNFLFALLPTILTSLFYKGKIYKLRHKKEKVDFDEILVTDKQRKWMKIFIWIICILVVGANSLLSVPPLIVYEDRLYENKMEHFLEIQYDEYLYEEVEKVYWIKGRYNDWDEYIKRSSYVLVMHDGRKLDLDSVTVFNENKANHDIEKYVLPYLGEKGKHIIVADSDRDIE